MFFFSTDGYQSFGIEVDCVWPYIHQKPKIFKLFGAFFGTTGSHVLGTHHCIWENEKRRTVGKMKGGLKVMLVNPRIFWPTRPLLMWVSRHLGAAHSHCYKVPTQGNVPVGLTNRLSAPVLLQKNQNNECI